MILFRKDINSELKGMLLGFIVTDPKQRLLDKILIHGRILKQKK